MNWAEKYFKLKGKLFVNSRTRQISYILNKKSLPKEFIKKIPKDIKIKLRKK